MNLFLILIDFLSTFLVIIIKTIYYLGFVQTATDGLVLILSTPFHSPHPVVEICLLHSLNTIDGFFCATKLLFTLLLMFRILMLYLFPQKKQV